MSGPERPGASQKLVADVERLCQGFARAVRVRPRYRRADNEVVQGMMSALLRSLEQIQRARPELTIRVGPDRFYFEGHVVLEESDPKVSIPFAFFRDGLRRLTFKQGLSYEELDALVLATAEGSAYSGLGDDIVSALWQLRFENVEVAVVDTNIVSAARGRAGVETRTAFDTEAQSDDVLMAISGTENPDIASVPVYPKARSEAAELIAQALESIPPDAPGYHPAMPQDRPAYADEVIDEAVEEESEHIEFRLIQAALDTLARDLDPALAELVTRSMLDIFLAAVSAHEFRRAARIMANVRRLGDTLSDIVTPWVMAASGHETLRSAVLNTLVSSSDEATRELAILAKACGPAVLGPLISAYGELADPSSRRTLSDLIVNVGVTDPGPIQDLLMSDQTFQAQEAIYLLGRIGGPRAQAVLREAKSHPNPAVRLSLLENRGMLTEHESFPIAMGFLEDLDPKVRARAAEVLGTATDPRAVSALWKAVEVDTFALAPREVKEAFLTSFARLAGETALTTLTEMIKRGERSGASKDAEDLAVAAVKALEFIKTQESVKLLKKLFVAKNARIRDGGKEVFRRLQERHG
ncbi:MAG: HEAT repeat domain-containing protein [Deltaproteobacteria bacterium]|nr:HEAT repeat domain-containing protein [Deltaproteobacteria bacterium]